MWCAWVWCVSLKGGFCVRGRSHLLQIMSSDGKTLAKTVVGAVGLTAVSFAAMHFAAGTDCKKAPPPLAPASVAFFPLQNTPSSAKRYPQRSPHATLTRLNLNVVFECRVECGANDMALFVDLDDTLIRTVKSGDDLHVPAYGPGTVGAGLALHLDCVALKGEGVNTVLRSDIVAVLREPFTVAKQICRRSQAAAAITRRFADRQNCSPTSHGIRTCLSFVLLCQLTHRFLSGSSVYCFCAAPDL